MDWEKVGQAFQGGANVLSGGLMDKYQRQKDIEDWKHKTEYAQGIEDQQRKAQESRAWLEKRYADFPEMKDFHTAAEQGDPEAQKKLYTFAGAWDKLNRMEPLSEGELQEVFSLPPMTKGKLINLDLTNKFALIDRETKRKQGEATLEGTLARTEREKASTAKAEQDLRVAQTKPKEDVQYKRDSAGIKQLVTRFEYDLNKLTPEIAKLQTAVSNNPYARAGIASPELQAIQDQLTALGAKRDNIQKGRYAIFKYEAELQEGKPLSEASRAELNYVMNNPARVGTGDVFGGTEHFVLPGPAGLAPPTPPPPVESGALPPMPKEESYPVGTRRKNKRTGEIQVWDGTQWKPEK